MNKSHYLKFVITAIILSAPCFADGVTIINNEHNERLAKFNAAPLAPETYTPHTMTINGILKNQNNVNAHRHATNTEKETILKAVMASVVIHGDNPSYRLPAHGLDQGGALYKHFEILRLTESLASDLMHQLSVGFMDLTQLTNYGNLYSFSGKNISDFKNWFEDVLAEHNAGLLAKMKAHLLQNIPSEVKNLTPKKVLDLNEMIEFGEIGKHSITRQSVIFVSTYNLNTHQIINNGLFVHLPPKNGREKYIVIENPFFDAEVARSDGSWSPYTIRSHALINGDAQPRDVSINIAITDAKNGQTDIGISSSHGSVNSHDGTFSPNNLWLTNLPERVLFQNEVFSFVSRIDGDGKAIDTLHILAYDANAAVNLARTSTNVDAFLQSLCIAHDIFGTDSLSHLAKMMAFIDGRI